MNELYGMDFGGLFILGVCVFACLGLFSYVIIPPIFGYCKGYYKLKGMEWLKKYDKNLLKGII